MRNICFSVLRFCFYFTFFNLTLLKADYEGVEWFRNQNPNDLNWLEQFLPYNPVIIEAGAFRGQDTIKAATIWPEGHIIAFEPDPYSFKELERNVSSVGLTNVEIHNLALNSYNGTALFNVCLGPNNNEPAYSYASSLLPLKKGMEVFCRGPQITVPCVTLDQWCAENQVETIDLLRLEVEGAEYNVLKSSPNILKNVKMLHIKTHIHPHRLGMTNYPALKEFLEKSNFILISHKYNPGMIGHAIFFNRTFYEDTFSLPLGISDRKVEKYFKPALNKPESNGIANIDFIYVINLDKRHERYQRTKEALEPFEIYPYRFSAVNGWELPFEALGELGIVYQSWMPKGPICSTYRKSGFKEHESFEVMKEVGTAYYCHSLSRGAMGCLLSHLSIIQDAYDSGYKTIWVMEDDIKVIGNPHELSFLLNGLNRQAPDWDVLFTDNEIKGSGGVPVPCTMIRPRPLLQVQPLEYYMTRTPLNADITKIGMRFGSASMIINRSGMKKLLDYFKTYKIYFPYDIDNFLVPGINLYTCNKDIVSNIYDGDSDNGAPNYLNK